ncbi:hypothetical protein PHYPSEUDO_010912 [Phytophthora pseudosyringae]|uniref:Uncharacterized protein n=1 Tax=Phytophthora pseudosyringae TaxID=221518 RepID=A0A8T1V991_9STRA|nr:hypothetical protein PHYPSEUDO_010912 [Phytophthora pseudosyringae]
MTSAIDPHAFAVAIELTSQLSSDGAFVDEQDRSDYVHVPSNSDVESDPALDSEGVLVFRELIPDSVCVDASEESAGAHTRDAMALRGSSPSLSWWPLIEHMADVPAEDLLAMDW